MAPHIALGEVTKKSAMSLSTKDQLLQSDWLCRLASLNVAVTAARGPAPHKPLLLLCVIDMVEEGALTSPLLRFSAELFFRFQCYWQIVFDRQQNSPDMRLPFHALGGERDRIWGRQTEDGKPSLSKETTRRCCIDESLWQQLQSADFRKEARQRLVASYFTPAEQVSLCTQLNLPEPTTSDIIAIRSRADEYRANQKKGRDVRFRRQVLINYRFTCALTGYSLTTLRENMVEAAHIHQHSLSGNDDPCNGLALSPDAHWMFDRGLWTAIPSSEGFIVLVAKNQFTESSPTGRTLMSHDQQPLIFPPCCVFMPNPRHFAWHRQHRFLG